MDSAAAALLGMGLAAAGFAGASGTGVTGGPGLSSSRRGCSCAACPVSIKKTGLDGTNLPWH